MKVNTLATIPEVKYNITALLTEANSTSSLKNHPTTWNITDIHAKNVIKKNALNINALPI
ncbi:MAG: hypothetical protein Q4C97_12280 [Bacillota bacterium]|nr:hypothetical protein [Bacillota bacterium]